MMKLIAIVLTAGLMTSALATDRNATVMVPAAVVCGGGSTVHEAAAKLNVKLANDGGVELKHGGLSFMVPRPFTVSAPTISGQCSCPVGPVARDSAGGCDCGDSIHVCVTVSDAIVGPVVGPVGK